MLSMPSPCCPMRCSLALRPPRLPHPSPLWQTGVGPKTAASLLRQHGSLEVILAAAPGGCKPRRAAEALASKAGSAAARLSRQLVEIRTDLDLPPLRQPLEQLRLRRPPDGGAMAAAELKALEFRVHAERLRALWANPTFFGAS